MQHAGVEITRTEPHRVVSEATPLGSTKETNPFSGQTIPMKSEMMLIAIVFTACVSLILLSIEAGYRFGRFIHARSADEKESPVGAIAGSVLGLVAFMLAFTFGIVTQRYDAKKGLVREEANTIRTTWLRTDFLPEKEQEEARELLLSYVDGRLRAVISVQTGESSLHPATGRLLQDADRIQHRLWDMATADARKDMNSDVAALYLESLNEMIEIHASRVAIGLQQRIPLPILLVLGVLTVCGMSLVGYQTGIAASKRSWARPFLAVSFSVVVTLILSLDRPDSFLSVSQRPLMDLRDAMKHPPSRGMEYPAEPP